MGTFLFDEHVFGPIKSRRLGSSLGINLLSTHQKVCNYNCVYCECGLTHKLEKEAHLFVEKEDFLNQLKKRLKECMETNVPIDAITFAGNGEPTLHPNFLFIVNNIIKLRDIFFPKAIIAVLTNGTTLDKKRIREGLLKVDKAIIKLDAGSDQLLNTIDQPKGRVSIKKLIKNLKCFDGNVIIQTMFLKGVHEGQSFNNSKGKELESWLKHLKQIQPEEVMIYSLDRDTPISTLQSIDKKTLQNIGKKVRELNIKTQVV